MRERALNYPYTAPDGGFMIVDGFCTALPENADFSNRIAVLSVGSNRAPVQLFRKFGPQHTVLVTPVQVADCDIVHIANLAPYGAIPCAAFPSKGTQITLNIAWLTAEQLDIMHLTESLGDAYDFVSWDLKSITHLHAQPLNRLFGYASRKGALSDMQAVDRTQGPFALQAITAQGRKFQTWDQKTALMAVFSSPHLTECPHKGEDFELWLEQMQQDQELRLHIANQIGQYGIEPDHCPWETVPADSSNWFTPAGAALKSPL